MTFITYYELLIALSPLMIYISMLNNLIEQNEILNNLFFMIIHLMLNFHYEYVFFLMKNFTFTALLVLIEFKL